MDSQNKDQHDSNQPVNTENKPDIKYYNEFKQYNEIGGFVEDRLVYPRIFECVDRTFSTFSGINFIGNPIINEILKYTAMSGIIVFTCRIKMYLGKLFGIVGTGLRKLIVAILFKKYNGIAPVEKIIKSYGVNTDLEFAGVHLFGKMPVYLDQHQSGNGSVIDMYYPRWFNSELDMYLRKYKYESEKPFNIKRTNHSETPEFIVKTVKKHKGNTFLSVGTKKRQVQNAFKYRKYDKTINIIMDYLELKSKVKMKMPPLLLVYSGPPGVGKTMILDYLKYNYDIEISKYYIEAPNVDMDDVGKAFTGISADIPDMKSSMINIDELDKVYVDLRDRYRIVKIPDKKADSEKKADPDKSGTSLADYKSLEKGDAEFKNWFLGELFVFINSLPDGTIVLLTVNDQKLMFGNVDNTYSAVVSRIIFQEIGNYNKKDICDYIKFYNEELKNSSKIVHVGLEKKLECLRDDVTISARELTQIMLTNRFDYDIIIEEINKINTAIK